MSRFVQHEEFRKMNVAYCLDEGLANPDNFFTVFYGERVAWCKCLLHERVLSDASMYTLQFQFTIHVAQGLPSLVLDLRATAPG